MVFAACRFLLQKRCYRFWIRLNDDESLMYRFGPEISQVAQPKLSLTRRPVAKKNPSIYKSSDEAAAHGAAGSSALEARWSQMDTEEGLVADALQKLRCWDAGCQLEVRRRRLDERRRRQPWKVQCAATGSARLGWFY